MPDLAYVPNELLLDRRSLLFMPIDVPLLSIGWDYFATQQCHSSAEDIKM